MQYRIDYECLGDLVPSYVLWDESTPEDGSFLFYTLEDAIEFALHELECGSFTVYKK
jgi:hypothetical protein